MKVKKKYGKQLRLIRLMEIDRINTHKTNDEFFSSMKNGNGKKSK